MPNKYAICSDLHLEFRQGKEKEFWEEFPEHKEAKVCICAGDVSTLALPDPIFTKHYAKLCERFDLVIAVPGNHEYYGTNPTQAEEKLLSLEDHLRPSLKILRAGETFTYLGQRFIGDTMWFPDVPEVHIYRREISDSFQIKGLFPWCFTQSSLFLSFLQSQMSEDDIVVTHHIPTDVDTAPHWKKANSQAYFVNKDCERLLANPNIVKPKAWIYGHTHDFHNYSVGRTKYICSPLGYPNENNSWRTRQLIYEL